VSGLSKNLWGKEPSFTSIKIGEKFLKGVKDGKT
jgi:hypothetical protein